jgi:heme A synthase
MKLLHRLALAVATLTFLLLLVGGLVHGTGSSLACPDWPLCFGEAFPRMVGGVLYEHSHRLFAGGVGALTLAIAVLSVRARHHDSRLAWLGPLLLAMVLVQGLLGGLTVIYRLPTLVSTAHLALSMLFFAALVYLAWRTRPRPLPQAGLSAALRGWIAVATGAVYAQVVLGGLVRHTGAGVACGDELPLCGGGRWWNGLSSIARLQVVHRAGAIAVALLVLLVSGLVLRAARGRRLIQCAAAIAAMLIGVQIVLGVLAVQSWLGLWQVTAHLGGGALLVADLWLLWLAAAPETLLRPERERAAPSRSSSTRDRALAES